MTSSAQQMDLNPVSPTNLLDPSPLYRALREDHPVHWSKEIHCWLVTRYDDVTDCFRNSRLSADRSNFYSQQLQGLGTDIAEGFLKSAREQMTMLDGPKHIRLRRMTNPGFTPQALDTTVPTIRRTMESLVDGVKPRGHMDLVKEIAYLLPPLVISEMLGVPPEDREKFQHWAAPLALFSSPSPTTDMVAVAKAASRATEELSAYLTRSIEERRRSPGDDMLTRMIHAMEEGNLTQESLIANSILLLTAGHITTTDQICNALYELLRNPEQAQKLREDPGLLKSAVEEILRFRPAVPFAFRVVKETFQLRGQTLQEGQVVFMGLASANRDPAIFPDPDRFDITRDYHHQKHLTFSFGAHHCLGAGLARRELEIAIEVLLLRLPSLRLDETRPPQLKSQGLLFRGFESMHVRW